MNLEIRPPSSLSATRVDIVAPQLDLLDRFRLHFYSENDKPAGPTLITTDKGGKVLARSVVRVDKGGHMTLQDLSEEITPQADKGSA